MILNIASESTENGIIINMPNINLNRKLKYKIAVNRLFIVFDTVPEELMSHDLILLRSNVVDRSAENPQQSIVYFECGRKNKYISHCPHSPNFYPLRLYELAGASFDLFRLDGTELKTPVKQFFLQLEIKRNETYGWIQ